MTYTNRNIVSSTGQTTEVVVFLFNLLQDPRFFNLRKAQAAGFLCILGLDPVFLHSLFLLTEF